MQTTENTEKRVIPFGVEEIGTIIDIINYPSPYRGKIEYIVQMCDGCIKFYDEDDFIRINDPLVNEIFKDNPFLLEKIKKIL